MIIVTIPAISTDVDPIRHQGRVMLECVFVTHSINGLMQTCTIEMRGPRSLRSAVARAAGSAARRLQLVDHATDLGRQPRLVTQGRGRRSCVLRTSARSDSTAAQHSTTTVSGTEQI